MSTGYPPVWLSSSTVTRCRVCHCQFKSLRVRQRLRNRGPVLISSPALGCVVGNISINVTAAR